MRPSRLPQTLRLAALCATLTLLSFAVAPPAPAQAASHPAADPSQTEAMPPAPPEEAPRSAAEAVRLSYVEGTVRVSDATGKLFDQALQNMAVLPGMRVETGNNGQVELQFPDGSVARVTPNSGLELTTLLHGKVNADGSTLKPLRGLTYYELAPGAKGHPIQVGPLTVQPAQVSIVLRVNLDSNPYEAAMLNGSALFVDDTGNASYTLQAGQTIKIDPAAASNYDVVQDTTADSWDGWNADRDNVLADLAGGGARSGGVHAGDAGWSDLDYYGRWYDVPGEGMAWAPDGVGQDFDPYGSGAWSYYNNTGYSWVSSYPWGWLPYHCGNWNFYGGNGWMWLPGNCGWGAYGSGAGFDGYGGGWYPYPRLLHSPFNYRPPARPVHPPRTPRRAPGGPGASAIASIQAVVPVQRGPQVRFRSPGEPRPISRPVQVAGQSLQPMPIEPRPSYRGGGQQPGASSYGYLGGARTAQGSAGARSMVQPGQPGYAAGARMIPPSPGMRSPGEYHPSPQPGMPSAMPRAQMPSAAAPRMTAPPPPQAAPPAPHMSAPSAPAAPAAPSHPH